MFWNWVNLSLKGKACIIKCGFGVAAIILGLGHNSPTSAQTTSNIIVDLSMLSELGGNLRGNQKLALPPSRPPLSTLHVSPKNRIRIKKLFPLNNSAERTKKPKTILVKPISKPVVKPDNNLRQSLATAGSSAKKLVPVPPSQAPNPVTKVTSAMVPPPPAINKPAISGPTSLKSPPTAPQMAKIVPEANSSGSKLAVTPNTEALKLGLALRIPFEKDKTRIPRAEKPKIMTLANAVRSKKNFRLEVLAYAGGHNLSASKTRRMSLSRALAVRSYLIVNGVRSTQIDVRALGSKTSEKPLNRVDLNLAKR